MTLEPKLYFEAVTSVLNNRVKEVGKSRDNTYFEVGIPEESKTISVTINTTNKITAINGCTCKHHSVKDVYVLGFCSAILAVLFYRMLKLHKRLVGEVG